MDFVKDRAELIEQWKVTYAIFCRDVRCDTTDFESFCVGWAMAKGLTSDQGFEFYQIMITMGYF